jgi:16S rRNA (cytosine967-C5)-methyltransferase
MNKSTTESWYSSPPVQSWLEYQDGSILDQNFPSMVASRALGPVKGDVVLEMCCGAGGKTTHVAQLMQDEGTIYAVDRAAIKIGRLRERASRMGISIIKPVVSRSERLKDALDPVRRARLSC